MLDKKILKKLESLTEIPTIPTFMSQVLQALDNPQLSASQLASLIERDQALTAKVLRVANSPFYGFACKISTIDLAVVIMGVNALKEIVMSLIVQKFFSKLKLQMFDVKSFWHYSVFCGSGARLIARKLGYRLAGEAFVAGLTHDIGILIIVENFRKQFAEIRKLQRSKGLSLTQAEQEILNCTHADIGAWIGERWNLPLKLCAAISNHHTPFTELNSIEAKIRIAEADSVDFENIDQQLTAIVSMSEWFADMLGLKKWDLNSDQEKYYLSSEVFEDLSEDEILNPDSAFELLKKEILDEYQKASIINEMNVRA